MGRQGTPRWGALTLIDVSVLAVGAVLLLLVGSALLYALYVYLGIWRAVFWESMAMGALAVIAAAVYTLRIPGLGSSSLLVLSLVYLIGFYVYTTQVLRNPPSLRLQVGSRMPDLPLLDERGTARTWRELAAKGWLYVVVYRGHW